MSFLGDIGNAFHAIGHFFTGADDSNPSTPVNDPNQQKRQQQQNNSIAPSQPNPSTQNPIQQQSQQNGNMINLAPLEKSPTAPTQNINNTPAQPNQLLKVDTTNMAPPGAKPVTTTPSQPQTPQPHASIWHDLTHNDVTNVAGNVAKGVASPFVYLGKNDIIDPTKELYDQATGNNAAYNRDMANQNVDLGLSTRDANGNISGNSFKGGLEKWAGNSAGALLTVAAPGVDNLAEKGVSSVLPDATNAAIKTIAPKVVSGAALGGAFNDTNDIANGDVNPGDLAKSFVQGAAVGGLTGGVLGGAKVAKDTFLSKAPDTANNIDSQAGVQPDETAVGVKSVNPTQAQDAAQQMADKANSGLPSVGEVAKDIATNPTDIAGGTVAADLARQGIEDAEHSKIATTDNNSAQSGTPPVVEFNDTPESGVTPTGTNEPVTATPTNSGARPTTPVVATPTALIKPLDQSGSVPGAGDSTGVAQAPTVQAPAEAAAQGSPVPVQVAEPTAPAVTDTAPTSSAPTPDQQTAAAAVQQTSATPTALIDDNSPEAQALRRQAQNAPQIQQALAKQLGDISKQLGDPGTHDVLTNDELTQTANRLVQSVSDDDLVNMYKNGVQFDNSAASLAEANAALPRLADMARAGNQDAVAALDNVVQAVADMPSKSGRVLNYAQQMFDSLPVEAKVPMLIRDIDKGILKAGGSEDDLLRNNLPKQNEVATKLTNLLTNDDQLRSQLAGVEGRVEQIQEAARAGQVPEGATQELGNLGKQADNLALQIQQNGGESARYFNSLLPKNAVTQRMADFARTSMLTAPSGRINNVFNVGGNSMYEIARSIPQSVMNKMINAVKGDGSTEGKSLFNRGLFRGFKQGLQKTGSELKGDALSSDIRSDLGRNKNTGNYELVKTTDNKGLNKLVNTTQALVKAPSNIIGGAIREAQVQRLASQEADQLGLQGEDKAVYTQARSIVPSKDMVQKAQQLQDVVSHMNHNPLADMFSKLGKAGGDSSGTAKGVAGLIKNSILAFPKYPATFVWNTLTDRNVVADTVKAAAAIKNGDLNGLTRAISGGAIDGTGMYVGYHLAKMGIITNKDAQGYSDDGAYLHLGDRYIPLGFFGVVGESLLGGTAIYNAVNSNDKNPASVFANTVGGTMMNTLKMAGGQSLVGADNQGLQAIQKAMTGSDNVSPADAAAVMGGQSVGQFIPGALTDVNSVLNQTSLNPTHEAAETKVTKGSLGVTDKNGAPSTAKAIPQSEVKALENRVPFLSQTLPRNPQAASSDFVDRVTRGNHVGEPQQAAADQQAAQKSALQQELDANIPVYGAKSGTLPKGYSFDNTLKTAEETGNYDNAIKGLNNELASLTAPGPQHNPPSKIQPVRDQITQMQVLKDNNVKPSDMATYSKTTLSEWRAMGDPTSSSYDPAKYQALWSLDKALADKGVAGGNIDKAGTSNTGKFYASTSKSGSGKGYSASQLVKNNTIGSVPQLTRDNFLGNLTARQISSKIPQIQLTKPGSLIKQHAISVHSPRA